MGTVLGQKQDPPLLKAHKKAGITNVGGITSLTNQAIDRLKYRDDSSGPPVNKELGHGYQQLIYLVSTHLSSRKMMKASQFMEIGRTLP
jgi:hypothetical protein